jgi:hypothetical protein
MESFAGTYSIDETGEIRLSLPKYEREWPAMELYRDKGDLILLRIELPTPER